MAIPSYRSETPYNAAGDVLFAERLNDSSDVTNRGYNSTLLNKTTKFGSSTDVGDADSSEGIYGYGTRSIQSFGRDSYRNAVDRNRFGEVPPVFATAQDYFNYIQNRINEQDDLKNNFIYMNSPGGGYSNDFYVKNPRWNFQGSSMSKTLYHPTQFPRLSGLYDTDLNVNTNLIQVGFLTQLAWFHLNSAIIPQSPAFWILYNNFTTAGSAKFKAVNESYFFGADNSNTQLKTKTYSQMRNQLFQNIKYYKNNYNSSDRARDLYYYHDNKIIRYTYARRKARLLDVSSAGSYWQYLNRRAESIDAWIYVSGSWNTSSKEYSLHPNYLYFRLANAQTGIFGTSRLPSSAADGATEGAIYR